MSDDYTSRTQPWGPNGPTNYQNEVTPNPTASTPLSTGPAMDFSTGTSARPAAGHGGGGFVCWSAGTSFVLAVLYPLFFGPFALCYTFNVWRITYLFSVLAYPVVMIYVLGGQSDALRVLWCVATVATMVCCVSRVRLLRRREGW